MKPIKTLSAVVTVNRLYAIVRYQANAKNPKKGGTAIEVRYGVPGTSSALLGTATIGGRWSQDQAIREFRRDPKRFGWDKPVPPQSADVAINLGPLAVARFQGAAVETPAEALALFAQEAGRFERCDGWDMAVALRLVPQVAVA